jgi:hypothetical protein
MELSAHHKSYQNSMNVEWLQNTSEEKESKLAKWHSLSVEKRSD